MLSKDTAENTVKKIIDQTKYFASIYITTEDVRLTRYADSEIHQNVEIDDTIVSLTLYDGKKEISCTTNDLSDEGLKQLVKDAEQALPFVLPGEIERTPVDPEKVEEAVTDKRIAEHFGITGRADTLKCLIESLPGDYTASGILSLNQTTAAFGDSDGVFRYSAFDSVSFEATVTHKDGSTGFGSVETNSFDDCDIVKAFDTALNKARLGINPQSIDLGAYTVILEPSATADLLSYICFGLNAKDVDDGISFAHNRLNEKIFGENVTIWDDVSNSATDPYYFDLEGCKRQSMPLVENGVVKNILHDKKTAQKAGVKTTGHAISNNGYGGYPMNVVMTGGDSSLEEMIAGTEKGLLITQFNYSNSVNDKLLQVTGLTRDGLFMIENGEISYPVTTMRFTESMIDAFNNITAISKERKKVNIYKTALVPAVKIENFHFTSKQK